MQVTEDSSYNVNNLRPISNFIRTSSVGMLCAFADIQRFITFRVYITYTKDLTNNLKPNKF